MPRTILVEEFHLTVRARQGLSEASYRGIKQTLDGRPFQADLRRAVRDVARRYPTLSHVRINLTR